MKQRNFQTSLLNSGEGMEEVMEATAKNTSKSTLFDSMNDAKLRDQGYFESATAAPNFMQYQPVRDVVQGVQKAIVNPLVDLPANIAGLASDKLGDGEMADDIAEWQGERDTELYGVDKFSGGVNQRDRNLAYDFAGFMVGASEFKMTSKVLKAMFKDNTRSIAKKAITKQEIAQANKKMLQEETETFSATREAMKGTGKSIGDSAKFDLMGTTATVPSYGMDSDGNFEHNEDYVSTWFDAFKMNALPSALITSVGAIPKGIKAHKAARALGEYKDILSNSPEVKVNMNQRLLKELKMEAGGNAKHVDPSTSPKDLFDRKKYGVFSTGIEDGGMIISMPKIGAVKVYRRTAADGTPELYMKKGDKNHITDSGVMLKDNTGQKLFEPMAEKGEAVNGTAMGYDSLKTHKTETKQAGEDVVFNTKTKGKDSTGVAEVQSFTDTLYKESGMKSGDVMKTLDAYNVKVERPLLRDMVVKSLDSIYKGKDIDTSKLPDSARQAIEYTQDIIARSEKMFSKDAMKGITDRVTNELSAEATRLSKTPEFNDFIDTMFNKSAKDGSQVAKKQFNDIVDFAVRQQMIKLANKLEVKDGKLVLTGDKAFSMADAIVNEAMKLSGVQKSSNSLKLDQFKGKLTEAVASKFDTNTILGEKQQITKGADGNLANDYILNDNTVTKSPFSSYLNRPDIDVASNNKHLVTELLHDAEFGTNTSISRLNSLTNSAKQSVDFNGKPHKWNPEKKNEKNSDGTPKYTKNAKGEYVDKDGNVQYDMKLDGRRLDTESLPIYEGETIAQQFHKMANTKFWYRDTPEVTKKWVQDKLDMTDTQLALQVGVLDGLRTAKGSFRDQFVMDSTYINAKAAVESARAELLEHQYMLEKYENNPKAGMMFDVKRVSTNRLQYTGFINPQQGMFSKYLFTNSHPSMKLEGIKKSEYFGTAVRTALDEFDAILPHLDKERLKNEFGIEDPSNFNIKKWLASDDVAMELAKYIQSEKANLPEAVTLAEHSAMDTIAAVANEKNFGHIFAEIDGITNLKGMGDAMLKKQNDATGIDGLLVDSVKDSYMEFQDAIADAFTEFTFTREDAKIGTIGSSYGESPANAAFDVIIRKLVEVIEKNDVASIEKITKSLKRQVQFVEPEIANKIKALEGKLKKSKRAEEILSFAEGKITGLKSANMTATLFNAMDTIEGLRMNLESTIGIKLADLEGISGKDINMMQVHNLITKLEGKKYKGIEFTELESGMKLLADSKKNALKTGLEVALGKEFFNLETHVTSLFEKGYVATKHILNESITTEATMKAVVKELGVKGKDLAEFNKAYRFASSNGAVSLAKFTDLLHRMGYDTMQSHTIHSLLPGFRNAFGDKVLYTTNKGVGFDAGTGMVYKTFAPINNPLPFVMHSTDSSMMGIASTKGSKINHRWDAIIGDNGRQLAVGANEGIAHLYAKSNIYSNIMESNTGMQRLFETMDSAKKEIILEEMAVKRLDMADVTITKEAKKAEMKKISDELSKNGAYHKEILKRESELALRNEEIAKQDKVTIQQYSDGLNKLEIAAKDIQDLSIKYSENMQGVTRFDPNNYKTVDNSGYVHSEMHQFELLSVDKSEFITDVDNMRLDTKAEYDSVGNGITLTSKPNTFQFWNELVHEGIHLVTTKIFQPEKIANDFKGLKLAMLDRNLKLMKNGEVVSDITTKENAIMESYGMGEMDASVVYGNEYAAAMLDNIITNEMIAANKNTISHLTGEKNLTKGFKPLEIVDESTGTVHKINTISELQNFLTVNGIEGFNRRLESIAARTAGLVNGSTKVRDMIFSKSEPKFETTLNWINNKHMKASEGAKAFNEKLSAIPFLELAELNPTKEALYKGLGYKDGAETMNNMHVSETLRKVTDDLNKAHGSDAGKYSEAFGEAVMLGLNKLFFDNMAGHKKDFNMLNINGKKLFDNHGNLKSFSEIETMMQNSVKEFFDEISGGDKTPEAGARIASIMNDVKALSKGRTEIYLHEVTNKLNKFAESYMTEAEHEVFSARLAVQKLSSIARILKQKDNFKTTMELVSTEGLSFQKHMDIMNTHGNKYSLFGENIEFQFLEHNKEGKMVGKDYIKANNIPKEEIVAVVEDPNGVKSYVITVAASERYIANQDSGVITVNLSDFEKGVYKKGKVVINAQNIKGGTQNVDKNIAKQIARNIYSNQKEVISKDLGYRQWHLWRDNGILLTKSEMESMREINPDYQFSKLGKDNPMTKTMGVDYYVNQKYMHYLQGTDGIDLAAMGKQIAGDTEMAKMITSSAKMLHAGVKALRNMILVARPSSYINSYISSMGIYMIQRVSGNMRADIKNSKNAIKTYRENMHEFSKLHMEDPIAAQQYWQQNIAGHELHKAMEAGLVNTIRADAFKMGSMPENALYNALKSTTGSTQYANAFKTLALDPTTPLGEKLGSFFDKTELEPKMALYFNLKSKLGAEKALQKTMMSFPTYFNLPHALNIVDQASPYTKFFASTPRMIMYGIDQAPAKMAAMALVAKGLPAASFMFATEEEKKRWEWYIENDFIKVPMLDYSYMSNSLFPTVNNPFTSPFGTTPFDFGFALSASQSLMKGASYIPGSSLPD